MWLMRVVEIEVLWVGGGLGGSSGEGRASRQSKKHLMGDAYAGPHESLWNECRPMAGNTGAGDLNPFAAILPPAPLMKRCRGLRGRVE